MSAQNHRYPFFHWMTGMFLCAFLVAGFVVGLLLGIAIGATLR